MQSESRALTEKTAERSERMLQASMELSQPEESSEIGTAERNAFRERLREVTRDIGTEAELERRAGMSVGTVSHYTRMHRPSDPSRAHLVRLALAAGVSVSWLAAGIGPKRETL